MRCAPGLSKDTDVDGAADTDGVNGSPKKKSGIGVSMTIQCVVATGSFDSNARVYTSQKMF